VRNVARFSSAAFAKPAKGKEDWEILGSLLARVERHRSVLGALVGPVRLLLTRWANPDRLLGWALSLGPQRKRTSLAALRQSQRTQDLGPLQSALPQALYTADKKVQAMPAEFVAELKRMLVTHRVPATICGAQARGASLVLIGRRHVRTNNSWMHNFTRLVKGPSGCTLLMHPQDAAIRHVFHGDTVRLRSRTGSVDVELALTEDIRPGVVSLPHGWGHDKPSIRLSVAQTYAGASINDVTDELLVDHLSGNAAVSGVEVEVLAI
jgi:anaerobic selenocysteine-containing dehydrogenase